MAARLDPQQLLEAAVDLAASDGLEALTFGRLSKHTGVSDRMLVYHFGDKTRLVTAVVEQISGALAAGLADAFQATPRPVAELLDRAWPVLHDPFFRPGFRISFELFAHAGYRREPYATLAKQLIDGWVEFLAPLVQAATPAQRRRDALAVVALVEGTFLLRGVVDEPNAVSRSAKGVDVSDRNRRRPQTR